MALATSAPISLDKLKTNCYQLIEAKTPSTINWDNVIGVGTYGLILGTIVEPEKFVVKIANKKSTCTTQSHEVTLRLK